MTIKCYHARSDASSDRFLTGYDAHSHDMPLLVVEHERLFVQLGNFLLFSLAPKTHEDKLDDVCNRLLSVVEPMY
jgi:hypothetical protein